MKHFYFALTVFLICFSVQSQTIENVDWDLKNKKVEIRYDLESSTPGKVYKIEVYVSLDGGTTFTKQTLKFVSGDVGKKVSAGKQKTIVWDISKEFPDFNEGNAVFDIKAIEELETKKEFFLGYQGSLTAPIGLIAGISGKPGVYVSARLNSNIFQKTDFTIKDYGVAPPQGWIYVHDVSEVQRLCVIAGLQFKLGTSVYLQTGLGFSKYNHLWKLNKTGDHNVSSWAIYKKDSFTSYEAEVSLLYRMKKFYVSAGLSSYNVKYSDILFGLGFML